MKASSMPTHHLWCYINMALFWCISSNCLAQASLIDFVNYEVVPVCSNPADGKPAEQGSFFVKCDFYDTDVQEIGSQENFEIAIEGVDLLQFYVDPNQLPYSVVFGPFQIPTESLERQINVSLESIDNGAMDNLIVDEVLCGVETNNGLNQPGYICTTDDQYIFAQAQPLPVHGGRTSSSTYVYILTDETGLIKGYNETGLFNQQMSDGELSIELFSIADHELIAFTSQLEIDEPLSVVTESSCYASCGTYSLDFTCVDFDLALNKRVVGGPIFRIGDTVEYLLTVINQGTVPAFDIVVRDLVPEGLSYVTDMNDNWDINAESMPIDVVAPEDSVVLSIKMIIEEPASFSSILNVAEIIFATDKDGDEEPAFDQDSTPDNEDPKEDDIDEAEILVLEALCNVSFDFTIEDNRPFCSGKDIELAVVASSDNDPITYTWTLNGDTVSRTEILNIEDPQDEDFGIYILTLSDMMKCGGSYEVVVEPILEERVSCINDINLTVGADCSLRLIPSMLTLNNISGINDYEIEVIDRQGSIVDLEDVSPYDLSEPLEVKLMHPCTGQTLCWSFVNAEYKAIPQLNFYQDTIDVLCAQLEGAELIESLAADGLLLDSFQFDSLIMEQLCLAEGNVQISDVILSPISCGAGVLGRIYSLITARGSYVLDTALIKVQPLNLGLISFPEDVANISCVDGYAPKDIDSYPVIVLDGDTTELSITTGDETNNLCQVMTSYSDQLQDDICAFGTRKVLRQWSIVDWCTDIVRNHTQHIYIIDRDAPFITTTIDTITVTVSGQLCSGDIDLTPFITVLDQCDSSPDIMIGDYSSDQLFIQNVTTGFHDIPIEVMDACGNIANDTIHVMVSEEVPPVPITVTEMNLSYSTSSSSWLSAELFDANSADACGPITVEIARASEIYQITSNGDLSIWELRDKCSEDLTGEDANADGEITVSEIFRNQIYFCCNDIDQRVKVVVRVSDQFGNYSETDAWVNVVSKDDAISCDDGDPCTIGDSMIEGCPCRGQVDVADLDEDGIPDCIDQDFIICVDGVTTSIDRMQLEELLSLGATPGPCESNELADIGGEVFTTKGEMIEDVLISNNSDQETLTSIDGQYAFKANEMYRSYELEAYKNDDPLNGVSALDMVMIQQYLLGMEAITDPEKMLAADINGDGRISAIDLAELRKILLGQITGFSNNTSWIFMPADPGINEEDPYKYETHIMIDDLSYHRMKEDWIGIKIGDLSGNAITNKNKAKSRSNAERVIQLPASDLIEGEEATIPFILPENIDLSAMQLSLTGDFQIVGLVSNQMGLGKEDYWINPSLDLINLVWTDPQISQLGEGTLFSLIVSPNQSINLTESIELNDDYVNTLYDAVRNPYGVSIEFIDEQNINPADRDNMFQNEPNPFIDFTTIPIYLTDSKSVVVRIYGIDGRVLHEHKGEYSPGNHEILIDRDQLGAVSGQLFYELSTNEIRLVRSMMIVNK